MFTRAWRQNNSICPKNQFPKLLGLPPYLPVSFHFSVQVPSSGVPSLSYSKSHVSVSLVPSAAGRQHGLGSLRDTAGLKAVLLGQHHRIYPLSPDLPTEQLMTLHLRSVLLKAVVGLQAWSRSLPNPPSQGTK